MHDDKTDERVSLTGEYEENLSACLSHVYMMVGSRNICLKAKTINQERQCNNRVVSQTDAYFFIG